MFFLVTYSISFVKVNSDSLKENTAYVRFLDTDNFCNSNSFLSQLKSIKKVRVTGVEWDLKECNWFDFYEDISNTIH